ncbi:ATP-binding protein [Aneurinibacillus aneurinilyticus]|nr:ATP-binding protein [Aneurinibacillus aneurinilyticus]
MWNNLIGNSIKFTNNQGCVIVAALKKDENKLVRITDNGLGLSIVK